MSENHVNSENSIMKNIVIVGGSIVGGSIAVGIPTNYRIVVIEKHSHFHYIFAFLRAILVPGFEEELFVPYDKMFSSPSEGVFVKALRRSATGLRTNLPLTPTAWTAKPGRFLSNTLSMALGANHPEPTNFNSADTKAEGVRKLKEYGGKIERATKVLVCGGGAAGIEIAAEIREYHADKQVTLVRSRDHNMPGNQLELHRKVKKILDGFAVVQVLGQRVVVPTSAFAEDGVMKKVTTTKGLEIDCDLQD
ncbi:hypothetical protein BJ742DRAFT_772862 [Cladochytrium replicatum]|nr:hypothetical protein BJ742DRAFT_772862 [Cladochytrium replicatum]